MCTSKQGVQGVFATTSLRTHVRARAVSTCIASVQCHGALPAVYTSHWDRRIKISRAGMKIAKGKISGG